MEKTIPDVVDFPNACETVRFTACLASMLLRAEGPADPAPEAYCVRRKRHCVRCGYCGTLTPLQRKHCEIYNRYTAVTGYGFLQIDLSLDEHMDQRWEYACQRLLEDFDDYPAFAMDYAGYEYVEARPPEGREAILDLVRRSIDREVPALLQLERELQWVLVTGYDGGALRGLDGSRGYWGPSPAMPAGYGPDGLFTLPDWYGKMARVLVPGRRRKPGAGLRDVYGRGIRILERMGERGYFRNSERYMRDDANFASLDDGGLLRARDRVARWIGQPIDQRAMLSAAMHPLMARAAPTRETSALESANHVCCAIHDVLWVAWRGLGEFMGGDPAAWARGLRDRTLRHMIADCFKMVCDFDDRLLDTLREAFAADGTPA